MTESRAFYDACRHHGISLFAGVPDSLLKDFCAFLADHAAPGEHIIAANEGNAVGLAAGHFLACGSPALVYMQNSGLGNAVNPLTSLADAEVYAIPMVLLVGWRGEPGHHDEPQHVKQGRVTLGLLDVLETPYWLLDKDTADVGALVAQAVEKTRREGRPVALVVRRGAFAAYEGAKLPDKRPMGREEAVKIIADALSPQDVIVSTTGMTSRELFEHRGTQGRRESCDFLTVGSMGHASSIAAEIALRRPDRQVFCLDGDGAFLMHMGALPVIGALKIANFKHVVLNNGAHDSVGGQPTVACGLDLPGIARACGYVTAARAETPESLREKIVGTRNRPGPALLEVLVRKGARKDLGRPTSTPRENRDVLMRLLGTA